MLLKSVYSFLEVTNMQIITEKSIINQMVCILNINLKKCSRLSLIFSVCVWACTLSMCIRASTDVQDKLITRW